MKSLDDYRIEFISSRFVSYAGFFATLSGLVVFVLIGSDILLGRAALAISIFVGLLTLANIIQQHTARTIAASHYDIDLSVEKKE